MISPILSTFSRAFPKQLRSFISESISAALSDVIGVDSKNLLFELTYFFHVETCIES